MSKRGKAHARRRREREVLDKVTRRLAGLCLCGCHSSFPGVCWRDTGSVEAWQTITGRLTSSTPNLQGIPDEQTDQANP